MTKFRMSCPIKDCDDGELTVEIQGKYRPARGFDPPEYPEVAILETTFYSFPAPPAERESVFWYGCSGPSRLVVSGSGWSHEEYGRSDAEEGAPGTSMWARSCGAWLAQVGYVDRVSYGTWLARETEENPARLLTEAASEALRVVARPMFFTDRSGTVRWLSAEDVPGADDARTRAPQRSDAEGVQTDGDDHVQTLLELARAGREADFRDLGAMLGIQGARLDELWEGTVARTQHRRAR